MSRHSAQMRKNTIGGCKRFLLSGLTAAALLLAFLPAGPTFAAGYVYQQHTINAGVLFLGTAATPVANAPDPAPYLFYVLSHRPDVKPAELTLINPLAPTNVTLSIYNRWAAAATPYTLNQAVTPDMAAYWEVALSDVSGDQLAQYNVLYLAVGSNAGFTPAISEKLRRFVDNGGQLIVEYGASAGTPTLFTGTGSAALGTSSTVGPPPVGTAFLRHPIISQPYLLSAQDVLDFGTVANSITGNAESGSLFSPVLTVSSGASAVSAAQIGAGQVVVSTLNAGPGASVDAGTAFVSADLYKASVPDMKLLINTISWAGTHPNENKSSHGNASATGLSSFSEAWEAPLSPAGTTPPPGAAVWGNFVFVTDASGTLHAFDAYPSENLTGGASTDDGIPDYSTGTAYDEIWRASVGSNASAPTVAAFKGVNYVFVEKSDGSIVYFNAVTGPPAVALTPPKALTGYTAASYPQGAAGQPGYNAPSPTYYDGRLYAGQANGTLDVYDLNEGSSVAIPLDPNVPGGTSEAVTGPASVGTLVSGDTSIFAAVVPTNYNVFTVLLGARDEALKTYPNSMAITGYSINRRGHYDLDNVFADYAAVPALQAYDYSGTVQAGPTMPDAAPGPQDPLFTTTDTAGLYTDWDMDFASAVGTGTPNPVNLSYISASGFNELTTPTSAVVSAPASDRNGDFYYTETNGINSYLIGVQNNPIYTSLHLKFRFLLPAANVTSLTDADNINYVPLAGYQFVGAPVIDDQDNVYVVATKGNSATVLCFRGDQQVSAVLPAGSTADLTQAAITQTDEAGGPDNTISRGPDTNAGAANANYGQFLGSSTSLVFYNFGRHGSVQQVAGDLTEPQPVTATITDGTNPQTMTTLLMHTNMAWYVTPFNVTGPVTGLSQVGSSLFLTDGTNLYRLTTTPQVPSATREVLTGPSVAPIGAGAVGAAPSVGGSVMVINGENGVAALTRQTTVIADNNRVLSVDGDGGAVWAVDATTRTDTATGVSTKVAFSHPTALSQFALNDYLVADTGSNRCVRFDTGGNVQWELTRFQDPNGLLAAGQPLTLSQPTSVVTRAGVGTGTYAGDTATYYLIADSGNNRVLEVADFVNPTTGVLDGNHVLTWVSHTGDKDGRSYRYGSAAYYPNTTAASLLSIAATVTNTRVGPLAAAGPGPVSGDAPGGSIAVFNYPAAPVPFNTVPTPASDLVFTTAVFYAQSQLGGNYTPYVVRNPRFLQLTMPPAGTTATSPVTTVTPFDFLYADDNGAFDLTYQTITVNSKSISAFVANPGRLQFTQANYDAMPTSVIGSTGPRTGLPFVPTCVQQIGSNPANPRYLITQSSSQGELVNSATGTQDKIGGEIFEVDGDTASGVTAPVGGFAGNQTLSRPGLTGPLTQPTSALRLP